MGAGRGGGQRARGVGGEWARRRREGGAVRGIAGRTGNSQVN